MLAPRTRRILARIAPFGLIWMGASVVFLAVDRAAAADVGGRPSVGIDPDPCILLFAVLAMGAVGLAVGALEVLWLGRAFAGRSFPRKLLYKGALYGGFFLLVNVVTFPVAAAMELDTGLLDPRVWARLGQYLTSATHLSTELQLAVTLGASLFYSEVSHSLGFGVLANFFTGRYHHPREEQRVFMFADMKSSTPIAERLGHIRYFELLKAFYADLSGAIVRHAGEVYQYVGDEIVVSWRDGAGVENADCLRCFLDMRRRLEARAPWYQETFGVAPSFKAAFHAGPVTAGEIGVVKKEIVFTGDVLNATARIQALCNEMDVDVLLSDELAARLTPPPGLRLVSLGERRLRGLNEATELFTLAPGDA